MTSKPDKAPKLSSEQTSPDRIDKGLKWRMRWISLLVLLMVVSAVGTQWGRGTIWGTISGFILIIGWAVGIPFFGWHASVPFAGRILLPLEMLSGLNLGGAYTRDELWMVGDLPVLFFLVGWAVDWCLSGTHKRRNLAGRAIATVIFIWLAKSPMAGSLSVESVITGIIFLTGLVILWLPREFILPSSQRFGNDALLSPMRKGAAWMMARIAMALFVFLPSLLYLDLVDLPENLAKAEYPADSKPFYWLREGRAFTGDDLTSREIYLVELMSEGRWEAAISAFRTRPDHPFLISEVAALGTRWNGTIGEFSKLTDNPLVTLFYVEPNATADGRASAGILWSGGYSKALAEQQELRLIDANTIKKTSAYMHMAVWVVLANCVIILLVLTSPAGSTAAAWWLVIWLVGANMGWTQDFLPYVVERIYYMIWSRYGNEPIGGLLTASYALLTGLGYIAEWINRMGVALAGLWVALCWPHRPHRLIQTSADRFWVQLPKLLLVIVSIWLIRIVITKVEGHLGTPSIPWFLFWLFIEPFVLFGAGYLLRRRSMLTRRVPLLGALAASAILLRLEVRQLWQVEEYYLPEIGGWLGWTAVGLYLLFAFMMIVALERGKFLAPPHLEGQLWLVGVTAIPFVANIVGDPVAMAIDNSGFFLGSSAGWLAFAAAVWCLDPIFSWVSGRLSSFRVKGLDQIDVAKSKLLECCHAEVPPARVRREVGKVVRALGLKQCQGWRRCGQQLCRIYSQRKQPMPSVCVILPDVLASRLAGCEGALRLEEAKLEWKWAAFETTLKQMEDILGDVIILPVSHDGILMGLFTVPDLPENRVLLRPVVGQQLASFLAVAHFQLPPQPIEGAIASSV